MEHLVLRATEKQRENLEKLADYLVTGKTAMQFSMYGYCDDTDGDAVRPHQHACGTVACAVGHGPAAGITPESDIMEWDLYETRHLTWDHAASLWMFGGEWYSVDNTPEGAAARIYYALENGVPENYLSQMLGDADLSYEVPQ